MLESITLNRKFRKIFLSPKLVTATSGNALPFFANVFLLYPKAKLLDLQIAVTGKLSKLSLILANFIVSHETFHLV